MKNSVILSLLLLSSLGAAFCSCASTRSNKAESEIICGGYTDYRELTEDEFTMFNEVCGEGFVRSLHRNDLQALTGTWSACSLRDGN